MAALKINKFLCKSGGFSVATGRVDFSSKYSFQGFCSFSTLPIGVKSWQNQEKRQKIV
jgi:hypothetical protein